MFFSALKMSDILFVSCYLQKRVQFGLFLPNEKQDNIYSVVLMISIYGDSSQMVLPMYLMETMCLTFMYKCALSVSKILEDRYQKGFSV